MRIRKHILMTSVVISAINFDTETPLIVWRQISGVPGKEELSSDTPRIDIHYFIHDPLMSLLR